MASLPPHRWHRSTTGRPDASAPAPADPAPVGPGAAGPGAAGPAAAGTGLQIEIHRGGPRAVVVVAGELDASGQRLLRAVLDYVRSTEGGPVAVDLDGVSFTDTHGLAPVLGGGVVLVEASRAVRRVLTLLGAPAPRGLPPLARRRGARSRTRPRHAPPATVDRPRSAPGTHST